MSLDLTKRSLQVGPHRSFMTRLRRLLTRSPIPSDIQRPPFHLKKCDVRRELHVPGTATREYGSDKSGTIVYEFNSKGYRGEEYDPSAKFRVCVIGESNAFGTGLRVEETFG